MTHNHKIIFVAFMNMMQVGALVWVSLSVEFIAIKGMGEAQENGRETERYREKGEEKEDREGQKTASSKKWQKGREQE